MQWMTNDVAVPGGSIRVRSAGSGTAVLFVHGVIVNGHLWDDVAEHLDGLRLLVPDLPIGGHELPLDADADCTVRGAAAMLVAVLDHFGIDEALLVGNDTGGALVQATIVHHGDRVAGAVLTNCDAYDNFPPKLFTALVPLMKNRVTRWLIGRFVKSPTLRRQKFVFGALGRPIPQPRADAMIGPYWRHASSRRDLARFADDVRPETTLALAERFGEFPGPVGIAWTDRDPIFPVSYAERLAADFPGGRLLEPITGSRTFSPLDAPEAVADRIRQTVELVAAGVQKENEPAS